ncbi:MAG: hypothetical protein KBT39_06845 [Bacteroidales bacterium]|nr:hypothetical protein [Bacteroidales bacterium]
MNRLVIIGNGFDLAHGLKTSYNDFVDWYLEKRLKGLRQELTYLSKDELCSFTLPREETWHAQMFQFPWETGYSFKNFWKMLEKSDYVKIEYSPLFSEILKDKAEKGWVDIENEYYRMLKEILKNNESCQELNKQLLCLQKHLIEYLSTQKVEKNDVNYQCIILEDIKEQDISNEGLHKVKEDVEHRKCDPFEMMDPEHIMMLSFNYTPTVKLYQNRNIEYNFIHGTLDKPESIIFGFGDELDKDYKELQEANDNELLTNVKSVKYLEAPNYRDLLRFIESAPFQVFIMGHSCGLSDRTLLNTIFEHNNCVSIKPFFYRKSDGSDNYLELVQNISRNFTDMKLFRDRVVNKTQCEIM